VTVKESDALLHITYQTVDGGQVTPRMQLSTLLTQYVMLQSSP